ncbi:MAG: hypothetical protein U0794_08305 [Isosphaeraceae bacterium]
MVYRFATPGDPTCRALDAQLRATSETLDDLENAAAAFAQIRAEEPEDADALYNQALCLAWLGRNSEALAALDQFVALIVLTDGPLDRAAEAWTIGEVLRLGAGAEPLADDLRYVWSVDRPAHADALLHSWPHLRPVAMPSDPLTGERPLESGHVYEWLDRDLETASDAEPPRPERVPRVLATVIDTNRALRLSTPEPAGFDRLAEPGFERLAQALAPARKEASPLPIAWADAALGTFRFPAGLAPDVLTALTRGVVERYFETIWIHRPRHALGDRSPLAASRLAASGDRRLGAKLEGVVRFREQLGSRSSHVLLYQGYPFDRLRRRLGLIAADQSGAVDADDITCFSEAELDRLDPATLDEERLIDAFQAASTLQDDGRTARFAAALADREPPSLARLDLTALFAPLVREALRDGDPDQALARLDRAGVISRDPQERATFATWSAEVLARTGRFAAALEMYQNLLTELAHAPARAASVALDGAETLIDNGATREALDLLLEARSLASQAADRELQDRVERLIQQGAS